MLEIVVTNLDSSKTEIIMTPNSMFEARRVLHVIARIFNAEETYDEVMWIHSEMVTCWRDGDCVIEVEIMGSEES